MLYPAPMDYLEFSNFFDKKHAWYKKLQSIDCRYLGCKVFFNSKGFHHLIYKGSGKRRNQKDIERRLYLLDLVPHIIKNITSISNYRSSGECEFWRIDSQKIIKGKIITVICRRNKNGPIFFYSVWETNV